MSDREQPKPKRPTREPLAAWNTAQSTLDPRLKQPNCGRWVDRKPTLDEYEGGECDE